MKKALVLAIVCAFGLGTAAFASPFSGSWDTNLVFEFSPFDVALFSSVMTIDYTVSGWTLGLTAVFTDAGLGDLYFGAGGQLGAFSAFSYLNFSPATKLFEMWLTGAKVNIAGVSLYGFFDLAQCDPKGVQTAIGTGWLVGVEGGVGDFTARAEAYFNLAASLIYNVYTYDDIANGYADFAYASDWFHGCSSVTIAEDAFALKSCTCCACFSGVDIEIGFPFACVEQVLLRMDFTCNGFGCFKMMLNDIELSTDWLAIDDFDIKWCLQTKSVTVDLDITITSACLTPYFAINPTSGAYGDSGVTISDIELYALGLTYSFNGVSIKALTVLDVVNYGITWTGSPVRKDLAALGYYCISPYDELFQITVDSDSCCGGAVSIDIMNWFDVNNDWKTGVKGADIAFVGIFGWVETDIDFSIGIGSNFALTMMLAVDTSGVAMWGMGFEVSW